jgi:hypothetical protein
MFISQQNGAQTPEKTKYTYAHISSEWSTKCSESKIYMTIISPSEWATKSRESDVHVHIWLEWSIKF